MNKKIDLDQSKLLGFKMLIKTADGKAAVTGAKIGKGPLIKVGAKIGKLPAPASRFH